MGLTGTMAHTFHTGPLLCGILDSTSIHMVDGLDRCPVLTTDHKQAYIHLDPCSIAMAVIHSTSIISAPSRIWQHLYLLIPRNNSTGNSRIRLSKATYRSLVTRCNFHRSRSGTHNRCKHIQVNSFQDYQTSRPNLGRLRQMDSNETRRSYGHYNSTENSLPSSITPGDNNKQPDRSTVRRRSFSDLVSILSHPSSRALDTLSTVTGVNPSPYRKM